jgi:hypothetical protein
MLMLVLLALGIAAPEIIVVWITWLLVVCGALIVIVMVCASIVLVVAGAEAVALELDAQQSR